ncbi:MAG: integrase core domain-containing protein [Patescibacteria group bacterium]|nr:integrase core domain-containing protein [Patescibacteria group bacterium]
MENKRRCHQTDDEEFYILKGLEMKTLKRMLELLSEWIIRYNIKRRHQGLNDLTPLEYLKSIKPEIHLAIVLFPPLILDSLERLPVFQAQNIPTYLIGQSVVDYYLPRPF